MGRPNKQVYYFLADANNRTYSVVYDSKGFPTVKKNSSPTPLRYNPANANNSPLQLATNQKYFSLNRTITYPLKFVKDGADILRYCDYKGTGYESVVYLIIVQWNSDAGCYKLAYKGKIDFSKKQDDPKTGFTISTLDDSAWSILAANDSTTYQIDCSPTNPKAIKVLFDGITLPNKYNFQSVSAPLEVTDANNNNITIPVVYINADGDSSGIITNSQTFQSFGSTTAYASTSSNYLFSSVYPTTIRIQGSFSFTWQILNNHNPGLLIWFQTSLDTLPLPTSRYIVNNSKGGLIPGYTYQVPIDITINLGANESVFLIGEMNASTIDHFKITPVQTNIFVSTTTKVQPTTAYALRPLDLLQGIVSKATEGKYTIQSNYFSINNKRVLLSGDSVRNIPGAYIQTSFEDWFKSFNPTNFLALRIIDGTLWVEPATDVYNSDNVIMDAGEVSDFILTPATEYIGNAITVGSPKQDYQHPNGRYEFNSINSFSLPVTTVQKTIDLTTKYRTDGYGIEFIRLDLQGSGTTDNLGDTNVFMVDITDETESAATEIPTFVTVTINNSPLAPFIRSPFASDYITYNKPTVKGIAPANTQVGVLIDNLFDGFTTSDSLGNYSYDVQTALQPYSEIVNPDGSVTVVHTGVHVISVAFTDGAGHVADGSQVNSVTVTIDTRSTTAILITSPTNGDSLYNNKPVIKGVAQQGTVVAIMIDGVLLGNVTADGSCKWQIQAPVLTNQTHTIEATAGAASSNISFFVDSNVAFPLITSFIDGFPIINNLPLIEGVAIPGTVVSLYLNYISTTILGTATADPNGNWSYQVVPIGPPADPQILFLPNGAQIISTSLVNEVVSINVVGYKLDRPNYDLITGVPDNSVFNTKLSPMRMLRAWDSYFKSILFQQPTGQIAFQAGDKNVQLKTSLNGVTVAENANVNVSDMGNPLFLPINVAFKTKVPDTFNSIFQNFNGGGVIRIGYQGSDIYCLPIGTMSMNSITDEAQSWKLLLSPRTSLTTLLNLSNPGLFITLMKNALYIANTNPLHLVKYDYTGPAKYNSVDIFDDWFNNRNDRWTENPDYLQKWQTSDVIKQQIVTNGLTDITLKMYRCLDASLVDTFTFNPVANAPIPVPDIVQEVTIDFSPYDPDQYFFVLYTGATPVAISERIETAVKWANTILIEAYNSKNLPGCFYSTGFQSVIRVEGLLMKWQPSLSIITNTDEVGDNQLLHSVPSQKRTLLIGDARGLPDWLYLKIKDMLLLDQVSIEGLAYVLPDDSKLEPNITDGYPMYYYQLDINPATNEFGATFAGASATDRNSVTLVVDASAFGISTGVINIELDNN